METKFLFVVLAFLTMVSIEVGNTNYEKPVKIDDVPNKDTLMFNIDSLEERREQIKDKYIKLIKENIKKIENERVIYEREH